MNGKRKAAVTGLGCKVSKYEADALSEKLQENGYEIVNFTDFADVYIINTCTVTNASDKKSRQLLRRAKQINENAVVVASGCYSQAYPDAVSKIEGVDLVAGIGNNQAIAALLDEFFKAKAGEADAFERNRVLETSKEYENINITKSKDRTRAYIKIEDGCDNFCSYCIIPYARGRVRSRELADVVSEAAAVCSSGAKEIVLTGIHVGSYGKDLKNATLTELIENVHKLDDLKRLRLSSLEPGTITGQFAKSVSALSKLCDYFHLSLQAGCDKTLAAMNRKYTCAEYKAAVDLLKSSFKDCSIWTDVIVGFPGETDEDFTESFKFIKDSGISRLHIFPFSPKKGTRAYEMGDKVPDAVKAERAALLKELGNELYTCYLAGQINKTAPVLFEKKGADGFYYGHTSNYINVKARSGGNGNIVNRILDVRLTDIDEAKNVLGLI